MEEEKFSEQTLRLDPSEELSILKKEKMERYLIDESILFAPVEYMNNLPKSLKPIYLSLLKWNAFEENTIFLKNVQNSIDFCLKVNQTLSKIEKY
jgi:hypothetical protein